MAATDARTQAEAQLQGNPSARVGLWTDSTSKPGTVAIGIALRGVGSCLVAVDAAEYDGLHLLKIIEGKA